MASSSQPENVHFQEVEIKFDGIPDGNVLSRFHPTSPILASGLSDGRVILSKGTDRRSPFSTWKVERELKGQNLHKPMTAMEWNVNGAQLAAGYGDGTVIAWSGGSGRVLFQMKKHYANEVSSIAWNPWRQDVFATLDSTRGANKLLMWNTQRENGNPNYANHVHTLQRDTYIHKVEWISANHIAIGLRNGLVEIHQLEDAVESTTSKIVKQFKHGDQGPTISDVQWNEKTRYLIVSSWDGWIKIWSMDCDEPIHKIENDFICQKLAWRPNLKVSSSGGIDAFRKSKNNLTFACGLSDRSIVVWTPLKKNQQRILSKKHSSGIESLSFSPDGQFLASAALNGEVIIWSTKNWTPVFTSDGVGYISFSDSLISWMPTDAGTDYKLAVYSKNVVIESSLDSSRKRKSEVEPTPSPNKKKK